MQINQVWTFFNLQAQTSKRTPCHFKNKTTHTLLGNSCKTCENLNLHQLSPLPSDHPSFLQDGPQGSSKSSRGTVGRRVASSFPLSSCFVPCCRCLPSSLSINVTLLPDPPARFLNLFERFYIILFLLFFSSLSFFLSVSFLESLSQPSLFFFFFPASPSRCHLNQQPNYPFFFSVSFQLWVSYLPSISILFLVNVLLCHTVLHSVSNFCLPTASSGEFYQNIFPHILSIWPLYCDGGPFLYIESLHYGVCARVCVHSLRLTLNHPIPSDKKSITVMMFLDRRKLSYGILLTFEDLECFAAKLNSRLVSVSRSVSVSFPSIGGNM